MFLLRCAFWLSIVYASMSWSGDALRRHVSPTAVAANGSAMLQPIAERAIASVGGVCEGHEAQCFKDARSLTTLVSTVLRNDDDVQEPVTRDAPDAPVPMPVPRRRVATAVLTHAR